MSEENEAAEVEAVIETAEVSNDTIEENEAPEVEQEAAPKEPDLALESQQKANEVINRKHKEKMDAIRERDALQQQLDAINAQNRPQEPVVPDFPEDEYEDDYQDKVRDWAEQSAKKKMYDANLAVNEANNIQYRNNKIMEDQKRTAENGKKLFQKAAKAGMSDQAVSAACAIISSYNLGMEVENIISNDDSSTEIIQYLSTDHSALENLQRMAPEQRGFYLAEIKTKAQGLKPKVSKAPPPPQDIQGSGADADNGKYPFLKGARIY